MNFLIFVFCLVAFFAIAQSADLSYTCLLNGYDTELDIPVGDSDPAVVEMATVMLAEGDDQVFVKVRSVRSYVADIRGVYFLTAPADVPRKSDGQVDVAKGVVIDVGGGAHFDVEDPTVRQATIVFYASCPDGFKYLACKAATLGGKITARVSAALKRDSHFHLPIVWNRRSTSLSLKEGSFVYFYGRGSADGDKRMYYDVEKPLYQSIDVKVVDKTEIVPHFSTTDDLPSTESGILGTSYTLAKNSRIIIGFHVKTGSAVSGVVTDFTDVEINFSLGTEPIESDPLPMHVCPTVDAGVVSYDGKQVHADGRVITTTKPVAMGTPPPVTGATCSSDDDLSAHCLLVCETNGKYVKTCECNAKTRRPTVACTDASHCSDILERCKDVCDGSPYSQCECNLDPRAAEAVAIECGDAYDSSMPLPDIEAAASLSLATLVVLLASIAAL